MLKKQQQQQQTPTTSKQIHTHLKGKQIHTHTLTMLMFFLASKIFFVRIVKTNKQYYHDDWDINIVNVDETIVIVSFKANCLQDFYF